MTRINNLPVNHSKVALATDATSASQVSSHSLRGAGAVQRPKMAATPIADAAIVASSAAA